MAEFTNIAWCDSTFNPWVGCTQVSPGCDRCYAKTLMDDRLGKARWGAGQPRVRTSAHNWRQPLLWEREHEAFKLAHGRRRRVFCASLADVFDNEVPREWRADLFDLIRVTPALDWLLLTKRPGNIVDMVRRDGAVAGNGTTYLPDNVWLGATFVNDEELERDVGKLIATRSLLGARVLFASIEPMLSAITFRWLNAFPENAPFTAQAGTSGTNQFDGLRRLDWVIVGGESGFPSRPMPAEWPRQVRDECAAAGVPFFFKQWGGSKAGRTDALLDGVLHQAWPQAHGRFA